MKCFHLTQRQPYWCAKTLKETAAMLGYKANPLGVELFYYVKTFFVPIN